MLETLKITNLAIIDKSVVNFGEGFNVLTGETGAGKSLIVDALLFLTGARADKTLIKEGAETLTQLADQIDTTRMKSPSFKMILTATGEYAYRRPEDGIYVVPIGCLRA